MIISIRVPIMSANSLGKESAQPKIGWPDTLYPYHAYPIQVFTDTRRGFIAGVARTNFVLLRVALYQRIHAVR